jgi:hypothetical protein
MVNNLLKTYILISLTYCSSLSTLSQNIFKDKYDLSILFSSEFYNGDFKELNQELDSREILSTSFGLALNKKEGKSYTSLEFMLLQNYSETVNIEGYSLNLSTNYNILKKIRNHLLYPKLSIMISKYNLEVTKDLNNTLIKYDKLTSYPISMALGIGYEYLFNINYIKKHVNEAMKFSIGLNFEKTVLNTNSKWYLRDSNIDYFNANLVSGIKTKIVIRIIF